jgi:23S rRNA (cytosine1962-C5)-methyltransferase
MTEATTKAAVLTKRGAARAWAGHPWIYRSDIAVAAGVAGAVARVVDRGGRFLGRAFYNAGSEISLRIFTREDEALDGAWLRNRIEKAQNHRDSLLIDADVYRLLHAEADGIPGAW